MSLADQIYEAMGPFAEDDQSGDLRKFIEALISPAEKVYEIVGESEQEFGWSIALDTDLCPAVVLPWLAQWEGVTLTPDMSVAEQRQAIKDREGAARGRVATIRARIERTLTGTKRVIIRERNPSPYSLYIRTIASETPDEDLTRAAILAQKPAGIVLDYDAAVGITYIDLAADYDTYDDLTASGLTYDELAEQLP